MARGPGRPKKLGDHTSFTLRIPSVLHKELMHFAIDDGRSLNDILLDVIGKWWSKSPTPGSEGGREKRKGREPLDQMP